MNFNESVSSSFIDISTTQLTSEVAAKCLLGECDVILPTPNVKPCNNLDEYLFKSTLNMRRKSHDRSLNESRQSSRGSTRLSEPFSVPLVRNFEKILKSENQSQASFSGNKVNRPRRMQQDVFTRTEQIETNSGPMSHLKCRLDQTVKITIRRRRKIPYISRTIDYRGTLAMFDKHMNLYLKNVIESFTYMRDRKKHKRARHRDGIILRGDNIILVA